MNRSISLWSEKQNLLFLETLKSEPVIWNPNEKGHKDKSKRDDAWARIQDILNTPVEELKKKKESLMATYRGYHRKKEISIKSGTSADNVYHPVWFAYDYMDSFFGSVYRYKESDRIKVPAASPCEDEDDASCSTEPTTSPTPTDTRNSIKLSDPATQQKRTFRKRFNPPESQLSSKQMSEAFNNFNKNLKATDDDVDDECDIFGKLIVKKLKKLPEHEREELMFDIHALFRRPRRDERSSSIDSF